MESAAISTTVSSMLPTLYGETKKSLIIMLERLAGIEDIWECPVIVAPSGAAYPVAGVWKDYFNNSALFVTALITTPITRVQRCEETDLFIIGHMRDNNVEFSNYSLRTLFDIGEEIIISPDAIKRVPIVSPSQKLTLWRWE